MSVAKPTLLLTLLAGNILMLLCGIADAWLFLNVKKIQYLLDASNMNKWTRWDDSLILYYMTDLPMSIGQTIGAFLFPLLSELIGRKYTLLVTAFPVIVGFLLTEFPSSHNVILAIEISLIGLFVGGTHSLVPIYFSEIITAHTRGKVISSLFTHYFSGIFIVIVMVFLEVTPRALTIIGILMAVAFFVMFARVAPESPYYYLKKSRTNEVVLTLNKLRNTDENTRDEIADMQRKPDENKYNIDNNERLIARLNLPSWIKSSFMVLTVVVLHICIDFSIRGEYVTCIRTIERKALKIVIGLSYFLRIPASYLCHFLVDKIGRKLVLMISYSGVFVSLAFFLIASLASKYVLAPNQEDQVQVLNTFLFGFPLIATGFFSAMGAHPISFILMGELFSLRLRMLGSAIFTAAFFGLFATGKFYLSLRYLNILIPLVIFLSFAMIFILKFFSLETKGMSLQQIQISLNKKHL